MPARSAVLRLEETGLSAASNSRLCASLLGGTPPPLVHKLTPPQRISQSILDRAAGAPSAVLDPETAQNGRSPRPIASARGFRGR